MDRHLFLRACAGLLHPVGGELLIQNELMIGKPYRDFFKKVFLTCLRHRMEEGLIPGLTLSEHFSLVDGSPSLFIDQKQALKISNQRIIEYNIRGSHSTNVEMLSGGNQQRALLALLKEPFNSNLIGTSNPRSGC